MKFIILINLVIASTSFSKPRLKPNINQLIFKNVKQIKCKKNDMFLNMSLLENTITAKFMFNNELVELHNMHPDVYASFKLNIGGAKMLPNNFIHGVASSVDADEFTFGSLGLLLHDIDYNNLKSSYHLDVLYLAGLSDKRSRIKMYCRFVLVKKQSKILK